MTDKELDQLFKNAVDHPIEGADPSAAWAEANAMIRAEQGLGLSTEAKVQWSFGGLVLMGLIGMTVVNSDGLVDYERTDLSYSLSSIEVVNEAVNERFASLLESSASSTDVPTEIRNLSSLAVVQQESRIPEMSEAQIGLTEAELTKTEFQGDQVVAIPSDEYAMIANDIMPVSTLNSMPSLDFDSFHSENNIEEFNALPLADFVKEEKASSYFAFTAGATLSRGVVQDGSQGSNSGAFQRFGLKYVRGLSKRFSAGVGLEYYSMSGKGIELSYDSLNYGFGYNTTTHTIRPNSLHYISIPLELQVQITAKHQLALGADFAYLLNVRSQLEQSEFTDFGEVVVSNQNSWGYLSGLKDLNATASVAYSYNLNSQLDLHAMMNYGLVNVNENAQSNHMDQIRYSLGVVFKLIQFE